MKKIIMLAMVLVGLMVGGCGSGGSGDVAPTMHNYSGAAYPRHGGTTHAMGNYSGAGYRPRTQPWPYDSFSNYSTQEVR